MRAKFSSRFSFLSSILVFACYKLIIVLALIILGSWRRTQVKPPLLAGRVVGARLPPEQNSRALRPPQGLGATQPNEAVVGLLPNHLT